ncbi:Otopetrin-2 [Collichthys lucidus]|uniref:Otopetrin-2 n=1 Tax=Collichthys lucidus TaxID=240159 RepID=A0A4U5VTI4_COLLU|nr:Otopetrin-2 [Collichthys lucidus]
MENIQNLCSPSNPTSAEAIRESVHHVEAVMERAHHGGGWLLSGILCINILILGCALVSGSALNSVAITTVHKQIFLIILLLLTMLWMLFYSAVTSRKEQGVLFKDSHAGPLWLRGLVTFILYEVDILQEDEENRNKALLIHFIMNIVIVSLMSLSTVIGCIVYRLDHREHVSEKNPTRSLDVGLLVGASLGQFIISYFSIVAAVATGARGYLNALNLSWALLTVLQLGLQNYFIIEGLHREPFHVMQEAALHTNACVFQEHTEMSIVMESNKSSYFLTSGSDKPNWKRRVLKEVCAFLLLANIILWIMPAFGARPQFDHPTEIKFYNFTMWAAIVNIGLPFGIFYRMHSVASLFEVYLIS